MLQSIHAILHNILQGYSTVLDSAYYSTIRITILILQCSCKQIYFQAFLFQKCIAEILKSARFYILLGRITILQAMLPDYSQSTCTQTTCSLHPSSLQLNQPTRNFLLGEYAHSTRRNQDKNSTRRSLNATGIQWDSSSSMYIELQTFFNSSNVTALQPLHSKKGRCCNIDQRQESYFLRFFRVTELLLCLPALCDNKCQQTNSWTC